jgi:hypothetical protein
VVKIRNCQQGNGCRALPLSSGPSCFILLQSAVIWSPRSSIAEACRFRGAEEHEPPVRLHAVGLSLRYGIAVYKPANDGIEPWLNLNNAARLLQVAPKTLRVAAEAGGIEALVLRKQELRVARRLSSWRISASSAVKLAFTPCGIVGIRLLNGRCDRHQLPHEVRRRSIARHCGYIGYPAYSPDRAITKATAPMPSRMSG